MSNTVEQLETGNPPDDPTLLDPTELLESLKSFLSTLVPPTEVEIEDIFGNKYELTCSVSARNQIKILREFDKIKDIGSGIDLGKADGQVRGLVETIVNIATDEHSLLIICRCFSLGHSSALEKAKNHASNNKHLYEEGDLACADLFSLEEMVTAIVPLFIRLAKRTSQAITAVMNR
tara:strand:- start:357 stop:887 length:531 start_codon:yes stop_codon:yes gene_type:complete